MRSAQRLINALVFVLLSGLVVVIGVSAAADLESLDPSLYKLPHYGVARQENIFPRKPVTVVIKRPIRMGSCAPCHENLDGFPAGWLKKVDHATHFSRGISCDACHTENPHRPDGVVRIPMRVCFNCHAIQHGPTGEMASGECTTCHEYRRKPSGHTTTWAARDHADGDTHECVMCHRSISYCNDCHARVKVRLVRADEYAFRPFVPSSWDWQVRVNIRIPATMGDCYPCHYDIEKFSVPGLIFNHEKHFEVGIACGSCHTFYPHQPDRTYRIPMETCYGCHQVTHGAQGLLAPSECSLCHPPGFNLKPSDHTARFVAGDHRKRAASDPAYCAMCHKDSFCETCHMQRRVVPEDHKQVIVWRREHGKDRVKRQQCSICHKQGYCDNCHRVSPIPHPALYLEQHGKQKGVDKKACNTCHRDRTFCESCHHVQVARALLVKENCTRCHPEYKLKMLEIKNRGHMVHAAHFEMTNTPPFSCDKCHAQGYALGHDYATFQLCKECHGAYKLGKLIAKFAVDNGELCWRCHRVGSGLPVNVRVPSP